MRPLSPRERAVVDDMSIGLTAAESGAKLGISSRTIEYHRNNAMAKMGATNAPHLVWLVAQVEITQLREALTPFSWPNVWDTTPDETVWYEPFPGTKVITVGDVKRAKRLVLA